MPIFNGWIIRAVVLRLRQPDMKVQRRFALILGIALAAFLVGALIYLFQQQTSGDENSAAIIIFAAMGVLITIMMIIAYIIRRKTGADQNPWGTKEALGMIERDDQRRANKRKRG